MMCLKRFRLLSFLIIILLAAPRLSLAFHQIEFANEYGGKQPKQQRLFSGPRALASAGKNIYVADTDAHRVVVLDRSGKTVSTWGSKGNKPGQFKSPGGIAVDEQGRVYVADTDNHRIQVFDGDGKLLRSFGEKGSRPREFRSPSGIAVSRGLVYVADTDNDRVQVLTTEGIFVNAFTLQGKDDELKAPLAVAVDLQNRVYVLDGKKSTVRVFDPSGIQVRTFGTRGNGTDGFDRPQGLAVDSHGNIYVADTKNYKIKKMDQQGKLLISAGIEGDGHGQFRQAAGLMVDEDETLWVLDADKNSLQVFTTERDESPVLAPASPLPLPETVKVVKRNGVASLVINKGAWGLAADSLSPLGADGGRSIGSHGSKPAMIKNARGAAVDGLGNFWVADTGNDRLQKFNGEGVLLDVIGKSGSGEGEFNDPVAVAVSSKGTICVADRGNNRVQVFSPKGLFLGAFGKSGKQPGRINEIADIAVDASDDIYIVDKGNDRIAKYDGNGKLLWEVGKNGDNNGEFRGPESLVLSPDHEVYVLDAGNARVQVFDADGKYLRKFGSEGAEPGQFKEPRGLALEEGLRLYVGDGGNGRVQVFLLKHTPAVPKDLTAQARANEIDLSWKANTETYLDRYNVYRSETAGGPYKLASATEAPFFADKGLQSNKTFYYRISSLAKEGNESAVSTAASALTPKLMPETPRKVKIEAHERQVTLSWLPNLEPFMHHYVVYRSQQASTGFEPVAKVDRPIYVDSRLADETVYYYQVAAVGKEGDESPVSEVVYAATPKASLTAPSIELSKIEVNEIFAAAYKYYESHPLGKVVVTNNTDRTYSKVKLSFSLKDFMDFPTELDIDEMAPKQSVELQLKPVFSNKILEVTENTPLQSEIKLTYYEAGEPKTVTRSFPVTLYERHAIRWDQKAKVGSFVTFKDEVVTDFTRAVVQPYIDTHPNLPKSIVYARAIYDALGVMGVAYLVDPTPYAEVSQNATIVDYTLYPRDVLAKKSGDCDGLSMLFAAAEENIGIETALIDVPGHVFVMFNTGVSEKDRNSLGMPDELLVPYQGSMWVPLEMTIVGAPFTQAWQKGAEEYRDWTAKGKADIIGIHKAWEQFKPVTLAAADFKPAKVKSEEIEAKYKGELEDLARQRLVHLSAEYRAVLKKRPGDMSALAQLGILYGENGMYTEALEQFQKMLAQDKTSAVALNNVGNISFLQGRLDEARQAYDAALKASPQEPGIMVNLARAALKAGKKEEARKLMQDAASIDPRVLRQYADLAASLGIVK